MSTAVAAERAALLRAWALEAGFDRAGVARLEPSDHGEALRRWLERGDHASMEWLERRVEARTDPRRLLDGARSALCVALHYAPLRDEGEPDGDLWPRVARYARGADYHDLMTRRLRTLGERVEGSFPGARSRAYVDTGPILERELAQRAGLGRIGKNTNLLHRQGSWFLLGELLLTLELEPDQPIAADLCGTCTLCLEACPTGALPEPYRLDSRRCISYWTIEHRGAIPPERRAEIGDWVFGCDVCQEVCPWNRKPGRDGVRDYEHPELRLPPERVELDLDALMGLDADGYVRRFRGSPMKRAKRAGLRRNAAIAAGNRRDPARLAALRASLEDSDPLLRRHAAWALGRLATPPAAAALRGALRREGDGSVRCELLAALAARGS
ncbi:MAG TPA: tRNA epoxyqueuosine(34) reductase QueG [Thermoanaerobaculia bacterium]|nr:tRNA epoxyqueuosine(34) reductase QueG [Thermoanaerobaculia bacterium]